MTRTCPKGHTYNKSSDCPTCPVCEREKSKSSGWMSSLPSPARRALESQKIKTKKQLAGYSEQELLKLHGLGKNGVLIIKELLHQDNLSLKKI